MNLPAVHTPSPRDLLLPYQRAWCDDAARWKMGVWSRQTGKDFSSTEEVVRHAMGHPKTTWLIGAPSERQALETLAKAREWTEAYEMAIADAQEERFDGPQSLLKASTIVLPNAARIVAVPGRPDTVRGFSANICLTEAAFFEDFDATWRAVLPSLTNPLRGGEKIARIYSTPNGKTGMFYKIWEKNYIHGGKDVPAKSRWSCHKVTIHDAVRMGLPVDIEELRAAFDDPIGWAQEFECEFIDSSNTLLPYDLIALAESASASEYCDPSDYVPRRNRLYIGIDFGRTSDPTVAWVLEQVGDVLWTREVLVLRDMSTKDQEAILAPRIKAASMSCLDYTGPGIGLGDYLVDHVGEYAPESHRLNGRLELCNFSAAFKRELFPHLRRAFEAPVSVRIPISVEIREDLHAMRQVVNAGQYSYSAPRTAEGHSDRCTALALAIRAAQSGAGICLSSRVARRDSSIRGNSRYRLPT